MPDTPNQISAGNGRKLLQIIPINIMTIFTMIVCSVGLYWKFDERIAALEKAGTSSELTNRVSSLEKKFDDLSPTIVRTDTNVQWLMDKQSPGAPKGGPPK
jgi:hypothetical protein